MKRLSSATLLIISLVIVSFSSCKGKMGGSAGIKKDYSTGLNSTYKNMQPDKVLLIMNNEPMDNSDVPLGAKFLVVNEDVTGLTEKDGKVSVGCSLQISDASGKVLLNEQDLFAGEDVFAKDEAGMLRCTVTTGNPMQSGNKYDIAVRFWDKYGDGHIENKVKIKSVR